MHVFDCEGDGLNPTKIHVLSVRGKDGSIHSTNDYDKMRKFLTNASVLIAHNCIRFDIPVFERILGIKIKARLVDTLALSWYLNHEMKKHGLEVFGTVYNIPKPKIEDWETGTYEEYKHRCEEDVKINGALWDDLWARLKKLYGSEEEAWRLIDYLTFKMNCARLQEESRWKLDVARVEQGLKDLEEEKESKTAQLALVMPKVAKKAKKKRPAKPGGGR